MRTTRHAWIAATVLGGVSIGGQERARPMADVRLMTVDPGHFHAALVQKEMYPGVSKRVHVFAPLGFIEVCQEQG